MRIFGNRDERRRMDRRAGLTSTFFARRPGWGAGGRVLGYAIPLLRSVASVGIGTIVAHAIVGLTIFTVAGWLLVQGLGDSGLVGAVGSRSLALALVVVGLVGGAAVGVAVAGGRVLELVEEEFLQLLRRVTPEEAEGIFPSVPTARVRAAYDAAVGEVVGRTIEPLPAPAFLERRLERRFREALFEEFLADIEARGRSTIGFPEFVDWAARAGLPHATDPFHAQLRVYRLALLAALGLALAVALALLPLYALVTTGELSLATGISGTRILGGFALLGGAIFAFGQRGADGFERPRARRVGMAALGAQVAAWPWIYGRLASADLGMVWIVILGATAWGVKWAVEQAFVRARKPRFHG